MTNPIPALRPLLLSTLIKAGLASMLVVPVAHAAVTTCTVTTNADDPATASAAVGATTDTGTLRDCMLAANLLTGSSGRPTAAGMTIVFDAALAGATISLGNDLPMLFNNTRIDASAPSSPVIIDGGNTHRIFLVSGLPPIPVSGVPDPDGAQAIVVALTNLTLRHGVATGGATTHGGGGMGAGGALFVNQAATVTIRSVSFLGNRAQGGAGAGPGGHGGGGGMGAGLSSFNGGGGLGSVSPSEGGAGIGTGGTVAGASGGWGGQGLGQLSAAQAFNPADFDVDAGAGASGLGLIGGGGGTGRSSAGFGGGGAVNGNGGFGGGGGAGVGNPTTGGNGGFGGGGGSGFASAQAASGGFGGGGGNGGSAAGTGGADDAGGGAGFGGSVFVRSGGSLVVQEPGSAGSLAGGTVTAGGGLQIGAAAGDGIFVMSGATTTFDITGRYSVGDALADDSPSTLPAGQSYRPGTGAGAAIEKLGAGTLVFSGSNSYAGQTTVSDGVLRIATPGTLGASSTSVAASGTISGDGAAGNVDIFGTLAPGTPANPQGTLAVDGTMRLEPGALTCLHANGATASVSDLNVAGAATLDGVAHIDFSSGPTVGTAYVVINAGSLGGSFVAFETNLPNLDGHFTYSPTTATFTVDASDVVFADSFDGMTDAGPCAAAFAN